MIGPAMDPNRHWLAYGPDVKSLKESVEPKEVKGEASRKIIDASGVASDTQYWEWTNWPGPQIAAHTKLNEHDKDKVWIIASRESIPDSNEELLRMEYQSILLVQQHECLNGWTKDAKNVYYIISRIVSRTPVVSVPAHAEGLILMSVTVS